jgi:hypothetical protein
MKFLSIYYSIFFMNYTIYLLQLTIIYNFVVNIILKSSISQDSWLIKIMMNTFDKFNLVKLYYSVS